jgi:hypothetical protein
MTVKKKLSILYAPAYELRLKQASSSLARKDVMSQGIQGPLVGNAGAVNELPHSSLGSPLRLSAKMLSRPDSGDRMDCACVGLFPADLDKLVAQTSVHNQPQESEQELT